MHEIGDRKHKLNSYIKHQNMLRRELLQLCKKSAMNLLRNLHYLVFIADAHLLQNKMSTNRKFVFYHIKKLDLTRSSTSVLLSIICYS